MRPLQDPQRRAAYDRFGHAAFETGGWQHSAAAASGRNSLLDVGHFRGSVRRVLGGGRGRGGRRGAPTGLDLRYNMEIALTEAYNGKTAQIRADICLLRAMRVRRQAGHQSQDLPDLQRPRRCAHPQLLHGGADLPDLPGTAG